MTQIPEYSGDPKQYHAAMAQHHYHQRELVGDEMHKDPEYSRAAHDFQRKTQSHGVTSLHSEDAFNHLRSIEKAHPLYNKAEFHHQEFLRHSALTR